MDLFDELAGETAKLKNTPDEENSLEFRDMCLELVNKEKELTLLESRGSDLKREIRDLSHKKLPDKMNEMEIDTFGLSAENCDIVLKPYAKAGISSDWDDDKKAEGFAHLTDIGGGDLIKAVMSVPASKGDLENMEVLAELVRLVMSLPYEDDQVRRAEAVTQWFAENGQALQPVDAPVNLELSVHWGTLTSFVKEQSEKGTAMDLEKIGATVGQVVKIQKRK